VIESKSRDMMNFLFESTRKLDWQTSHVKLEKAEGFESTSSSSGSFLEKISQIVSNVSKVTIFYIHLLRFHSTHFIRFKTPAISIFPFWAETDCVLGLIQMEIGFRETKKREAIAYHFGLESS